jgi:hypothetical protein
MKTGMTEEVIFACLLHDVVQSLIKVDHGWWGAQMFEPYIPEKSTFGIRYHQALRFYADEANGYEYPDLYRRTFGVDYTPEPYIEETYKMVRKHKWYSEPRMVTVNDLYAFDPNAVVTMDPFVDIVGRHFKQPKEGWVSTTVRWRTCGAASPTRTIRSRDDGMTRAAATAAARLGRGAAGARQATLLAVLANSASR